MSILCLIWVSAILTSKSFINQKSIVAGALILGIILLVIYAIHFYVKNLKVKNKYSVNKHTVNLEDSSSYEEILRSLRNQEFLVNFTNYLNSPGDFQNKINKALTILGKHSKVERVYIFEDYDNGKFTKNTFEWCKPGIASEKGNYQQVSYMPSLLGWKTQLMKDGVIHLNNLNNLPVNLTKALFIRKVNSFIVLPIYVFNNFFGFIGLDNCESFYWDNMEIGFLKTISMMLSNAFERRLSEEELKNSEIKFKNLFNHSSDAVFIYDLQGNLQEVNNRACEALELPKEILLKKHIESVFPPDRVPRERLYQTLEPQDITVFESEFVKKSGKVFPVEINSRPIIFNNENAVWCVARDISERKEVQRQILSAIIQTEEKERGRIAQDLHDGLGPLLSSLKLYAKVLGTAADMEKRGQLLQTTNEVIDESMMLIKEISNNLSPSVLNDFGLASAIQSFCKKITLTKEIEIKFDSNVFDQRFETNVEMVLFRILKELVNNTIKHALASRIEIFLLRTDKTLSLIYSDNGVGFDIKRVLDSKSSGMGISSIINRINSINGRLMFDSLAEKGIQVKIELELKS